MDTQFPSEFSAGHDRIHRRSSWRGRRDRQVGPELDPFQSSGRSPCRQEAEDLWYETLFFFSLPFEWSAMSDVM